MSITSADAELVAPRIDVTPAVPRVSVVVPTFGEEGNVDELLGRLCAACPPGCPPRSSSSTTQGPT